MDIERMKQLAGLNEAKEESTQPLEKSDAGTKSAVDAIKKGEIKNPTKHDVEDFAVVQDERGNVKVGNEKVITKQDGEPAKVAQPGKLKLKETLGIAPPSQQSELSSGQPSSNGQMSVRSVYDGMMMQTFDNWYKKDFMAHVRNDEHAKTADEIQEDLQTMFFGSGK